MSIDDRLNSLWTKESPFGQILQGDDEFKQALYKDMLAILGEDEPVDLENMRGYKEVFGEDSKEYKEMFATYQANMVKQYYRTKLKEYYGVEE